ncbi:NDP-hexose 2,3-dehydratase family protein [Streptomyces sp. NPDC047028]|uniref:NDP-hexose 2,3-dehydratase family protein n=1 Tax=Streptomyces sp. NPDC047028 TaxID=3155793 RepID=UPI0033D991DF
MTAPVAVPAAPTPTVPRADRDLPARFARSAAAEGVQLATADVPHWIRRRERAGRFSVERVPFDALDGWTFAPDSGDLVHRSGRFFSVTGVHATADSGPYRDWQQPLIDQPEVGVLGILVKEFDGVLHFLMQAKMEPGNPASQLVQLSPTVQATRSNYTQAHQGRSVRYIEYFLDPARGRVLTDVLQSEHGSWFWRKTNRNMIVEAVGDVELHDDFCWLTLGQLARLLHLDNVVNMDARTVLATAPSPYAHDRAPHSDTELVSWFTERRARRDLTTRRVPLDTLPDWHRTPDRVGRDDGRFFDVVGVRVRAASREVTQWTQPLIAPAGRGVCAFLTRTVDGVPHVLVSARAEAGLCDTVELGPTVQCTPGNHDESPPFLTEVLTAPPERVRYSAVHAEEGGRFLEAEARYLLVETDDPLTPEPDGFLWAGPAQLSDLVRHGHYLNVQARTLLACLNALAAVPREGGHDRAA